MRGNYADSVVGLCQYLTNDDTAKNGLWSCCLWCIAILEESQKMLHFVKMSLQHTANIKFCYFQRKEADLIIEDISLVKEKQPNLYCDLFTL